MHLLFAKAVFAALKLRVSLEFGVWGGVGGNQPTVQSEEKKKSKQWVDLQFIYMYTEGPNWSREFSSP